MSVYCRVLSIHLRILQISRNLVENHSFLAGLSLFLAKMGWGLCKRFHVNKAWNASLFWPLSLIISDEEVGPVYVQSMWMTGNQAGDANDSCCLNLFLRLLEGRQDLARYGCMTMTDISITIPGNEVYMNTHALINLINTQSLHINY